MDNEFFNANSERYIRLGIMICSLRKMKGISQKELAEKAGISRSLLGKIESPKTVKNFSLGIFFDIADALDVEITELLSFGSGFES